MAKENKHPAQTMQAIGRKDRSNAYTPKITIYGDTGGDGYQDAFLKKLSDGADEILKNIGKPRMTIATGYGKSIPDSNLKTVNER